MSAEPLSTKLGTTLKLLVIAFFRGIYRVSRAVVNFFGRILPWALGDRPGAYPILLLWIALIAAGWSTYSRAEHTAMAGMAITGMSFGLIAVLLGLAVAVTGGRWIAVRFAARRSVLNRTLSRVLSIGLGIILWIIAAAAIYESYTVVLSGSLFPPSLIMLPLAIVAACLHWIITRAASLSLVRKIGLLMLSLIAAVGIYRLSTLSGITQILGARDAPYTSSGLSTIWGYLFLVGTLALLIGCRWTLPVSWRALVVGIIGGCFLSILLSDPVITWTYNTFVPGGLTTGQYYQTGALISLALSVLLGLALGPLAVLWARPATRQGRLTMGAVAGGFAGLILFAALAAPTTGFMGGSLLFPVAQTRVGFNTAEWTLKLGQSTHLTFLLALIAFWMFLVIGSLVGALTALLTPIHPKAHTQLDTTPDLPRLPLIVLVTTIPLMAVAGVCIAILALLGPAMGNLLGVFGYTTGWQPEWTTLIMAYQPWLALTVLQAAGVYWLYRCRTSPYARALAIAACMSGLVNLVWVPIALGSVGGFVGWINAALGLEMLILGVRLYRQTRSQTGEQTGSRAGGRAWVVTWMWGLVVAAAFGQLLISAAMNSTLIQVSMIVELAKPSTPPPGLPWLLNILSPVYSFQALTLGWMTLGGFFPLFLASYIAAFGIYLFVYPAIGFFFSVAGIVALTVIGLPGLTPRQAFRQVRAWLGRAGRRIAPLEGRVWLRAGIWLAAGLLLDLFLATGGVFTVIAGLVIAGCVVIERVPLAVVAIAFLVTLVGALIIWLGIPVAGLVTVVLYGLLAVSAFLALRALAAYTSERWQSAIRLTALIGFILLTAFFTYLRDTPLSTRGGVSRYDGQRWQVFTPDNSGLGVDVAYHFYGDSQGNLWFGSNKGIAVERRADRWITFMVHGDHVGNDWKNIDWTTRNLLMAEAAPGTLWSLYNGDFRQYLLGADKSGEIQDEAIPWRFLTAAEISSPQRDSLGKALLCRDSDIEYWNRPLPTGTLEEGYPTPEAIFNPQTGAAEKPFQCHLTTDTAVALAGDNHGGVWLATDTNNLIHLDGGHTANDANWQVYAPDQGISGTINVLFVDSAGTVWAGTDRGLSRFDGKAWKNVSGLNDSSVTSVFVDSHHEVWAGTRFGAQVLDGETWESVIKDVPVTAFAEGKDGNVWIGTQTGVSRYTPQGELQQDMFNAQNSGMAVDTVRDLYVDSQGGLWVSTFQATQNARPLWPGILLSVLFTGGLLGFTYRGYRQSPETQARGLGRQISADPGSLYPAVYGLLDRRAGGQAVLARLPHYLAGAGDPTGAASVSALARLVSGQTLTPALEASGTAFAADAPRRWAESLSGLHHLLGAALSAQHVPDVTALELTVNPGEHPMVSARGRPASDLADFLPAGTANAWRSLEKISGTLRKYQAVDNPVDQLSYLADALASAEAAQRTAQGVGLPEGRALTAIADQWRTIVTDEINVISGRAELRLELRTRQVRRPADGQAGQTIQIVLRLQNTGRSAAENVAVRLAHVEGFRPLGQPTITLERLPAGQSAPVEFLISPGSGETARILCQVTWSDRTGDNRQIEFGDAIRFYDTPQTFQRIPNPYIVGHPIKATTMFYGRDDIFRFIADNLVGPVQDRTIVLYGQRRTGKTSILYQLLDRRLGASFIPVLIDMQELAPLTEGMADFLGEIAYLVGRAANKAGVTIETPALETFTASPTRAFNRFLDALEETLGEQRIALMFDEFELIESKISDGKLDPSVLGYLRSLIQHRNHLVFIFSGTHRLQEMGHDYWSVLFNIALHRQVSFLSQTDATALIRKPIAGSLDVDDLAVEKILNLTSGHAYFVQLLCWVLVNECNANERNYATTNDVNDAVREMLTTGEAHFAYIWQMTNHDQRLALVGLAHTIRPGKTWAKPAEIFETLTASGDSTTQGSRLVTALDQLANQDILEAAREGALRYRFQLEVLRLWVAGNKSAASLIEQGKSA